jgi:TIR domain/Pentapeptide repeats (8 copies)
LSRADLAGANLRNVDLRGANLIRADLSESDLNEANLAEADLSGANLTKAAMRSINLTAAALNDTVLADLDLSSAVGLASCRHSGASTIDHRTLNRSGPLPLVFLRGVGLPDTLIEYLPSILGVSTQFYSCFISYSAQDEEFARRIHADLQDVGVRCWFAPVDLPIGATTYEATDTAVRLHDKVLLILSEASIQSDWVADEVTKALAEERQRRTSVLFPIRVDDAVMTVNEAWALKLRDSRNIGDFRHWKEHDRYQRAFSRVVRDLAVSASIEREGR